MSYVTDRHSDLILAWIEHRISNEEFARSYPIAIKKLDELGPRILLAAVANEDPFDVEHGLMVGFQRGVTPDYLTSLLQLTNAPWHRQHENVISALDELRAPQSVPELARAALAQHAYLAHDKTRALAVKAIAALGQVGDAEAITQLASLRRSEEHILAKNARKQLELLAKTASSPALQASAQAALDA